ncbi:hypothetical protein F511_31350 [Dorcoceras hygrometricum]|uniref:Uncharacterized protein n=1 Tax=Dorcoceras hygrometricum TaxID=472368 RepID=A0A2Z7AFJ5_9LAMI|nr:hypothetical protein F511_31350 [Dorcoceras hygrometricum]
MPPRVKPVYASRSLNYEIIENCGENLAQDTHQSKRDLRRDKCPCASRAEQKVHRRVKSSSPPPSPSINIQPSYLSPGRHMPTSFRLVRLRTTTY